MRVTWMAACLILLTAGCGKPDASAPHQTNAANHSVDTHTGHDQHQQRPSEQKSWSLMLETQPVKPEVGETTTLKGHIQDESGDPITSFDVLHEKLVHLIVAREGLDEFAHLHPEVTTSGSMSVTYAFLKSGNYRLFVDFQPKGQSQALATAQLNVAGQSSPSQKLIANKSNEVVVGDIDARVEIKATQGETVMSFRLRDANGEALTDLQPYLGAMGHLVIISADGREYVHAHPTTDGTAAPEGVVKFAAHFAKPGLYKAWGQFQRNGEVFTVPYVLEHSSGSTSLHHEEH